MKKKIFYHDTDCGGVVYYANYLKFLEEARTEFLEKRGILIRKLAQDETVFVVARQEIDYKSPAIYGDIINIDTRLIKVSGTRLEFEYEVENQDKKLICTAKTTLACVGRDFKAKKIPEEVKKRLI